MSDQKEQEQKEQTEQPKEKEKKETPFYHFNFYDEHGQVNIQDPEPVKVEIPVGMVARKNDFNAIIFLMFAK